MANKYLPIVNGEQVSQWQQTQYDALRQREEAAQAAWSYPYIYDGKITKQYNTWKTSGSTFSIDPELQFVGKPNSTYSVYANLTFSGSHTTFASGLTVAISGTSTATGNTYETNYGYYYLSTGSPVYFTGTSVVVSGANTNRVVVSFFTTVDVSSDVLAWAERSSPATIGPFWKVNAGAGSNGAYLMRGSFIQWHSTSYTSGSTGFTAQI